MSKAASFAISLLLLGACAHGRVNDVERRNIARAMATNDCRLVDDVFMFVEPSGAEREFVDACHDKRQVEIISAAMRRNDCKMVLRLPGYYPEGLEPSWQRFVYHCWIQNEQRDHDSCIGLMQVGDASSVPLLIIALKRNEPIAHDGKLEMIDTTAHCLEALQHVEKLSDAQLRARAAQWSPRWKAWAERAQ